MAIASAKVPRSRSLYCSLNLLAAGNEVRIVVRRALFQRLLHLTFAHHLTVKFMGKELYVVFAVLLGGIHRKIGFFDQFFAVAFAAGLHGDADAQGYGKFLPKQLHWLTHHLQNCLGQRMGLWFGRVFRDDDELIASEP